MARDLAYKTASLRSGPILNGRARAQHTRALDKSREDGNAPPQATLHDADKRAPPRPRPRTGVLAAPPRTPQTQPASTTSSTAPAPTSRRRSDAGTAFCERRPQARGRPRGVAGGGRARGGQ